MTEENPRYPDYAIPDHAGQWHEPEMRRYIGILRRRIWAILIVFVIVVTTATVYTFKTTPVYEAVARILIEKQGPRLTNFEEVVQLRASDREYYKTQKELVRSCDVLKKALEEPGISDLPEVSGKGNPKPSLLAEVRRTLAAALGTPPAAPPEPWERLRDHLEVEQLRNTHLLLVKAQSQSPRRAAKLAGAVARGFEKYHLERKLETTGEAFRYLQEQKTKQEEALQEAETALQKFRKQANEVSLDVSDKDNPVLVRLGKLNEQLTEAQIRRIKLEAQFKTVEEVLKLGAEALGSTNKNLFNIAAVRADRTIADGRAKLIEAEKELSSLSDIYGPQHPQLQAARARVSLLKAKLEEALRQLVQSLTAQLEMLTTQEEQLSKQYEEQNRQALQLANQSLIFVRLQSDVQRRRKLLDVLMDRMREVSVTADFARTNVEVIEAAEVPRTPIKPKKARAIALSIIMGLLLGIGLAFFLERMDDTIKTPDDMEERIGIPVLGFVPDMDPVKITGNGFSHPGAICVLQPNSSPSEAYRNIRTSLFFSAPAEERKVLVVTSSGPGEGKTTTATNLALVIAQSGKRVLLVDADFRRPMIHKVFEQKPGPGLSTVLVQEGSLDKVVRKVEHEGRQIENLDLLVAGHNPPNPAELLGSQSMRRFLKEARKKYDRVIIDSPPVLFVADTSILGAISDGVIFVLKSAKNTRSMARRARKQLESVKARILGGVLNNVRVSRLGYYYSDYYYYGYSSYSSDYTSSYYTRKKDA